MKLILASTSPYRKALLQRLYPEVTCVAPEVAEDPAPGEPPAELAARLARAKAAAVAAHHPDAVVIGSDQVASLDGRAMGKPLDHGRATAQLRACSGRAVRFDTAVTVFAPGPAGRFEETRVVPFTAHFRSLRRRGNRQLPASRQALRLRRELQMGKPGHRPVQPPGGRRPHQPGGPPADRPVAVAGPSGPPGAGRAATARWRVARAIPTNDR